jgi:hypothetical protein
MASVFKKIARKSGEAKRKKRLSSARSARMARNVKRSAARKRRTTGLFGVSRVGGHRSSGSVGGGFGSRLRSRLRRRRSG